MTEYGYDLGGNRVRKLDPKGQETLFTYDDNDCMTVMEAIAQKRETTIAARVPGFAASSGVCLSCAARIARSISRGSAHSLPAIGQALHSTQDCYAHGFMSWPGHIFGTQFPFNEPSALLSDSFPDPADVFAAELDRDNYVERFHSRNLFLVHQLQ